jgi:glucokinase
MFLGIEIGGTKLQIGLGQGDGAVIGLWRGGVDPAGGGEGIRQQILAAVPELLRSARIAPSRLQAVGVGFGGPIDDERQCVIKSHQIGGWDDFPLADWLSQALRLPVAIGNDADVAGLAEALHGAGQGHSPLFYITIGSGIGGGFIVDGRAYRGIGLGGAEIGHMRVLDKRKRSGPVMSPLEDVASGWGIEKHLRQLLSEGEGRESLLWQMAKADLGQVTAALAGQAAQQGDSFARTVILEAIVCLAEAICAVIALLCPARIVIGGGVSLMGEKAFFEPLREMVAERVFKPFAGLTEIVPASLGEAVVVHGALALAKSRAAVFPH